MDLSLTSPISLFFCFFLTFFFFLFSTARTRRTSGQLPLPPGPPRLPLVGNIFQLGSNRHHSLAAFAKTYGPIMSLKLGRLTTVIISSPEAAKEALKTHDHVISARTFNDPIRAFDHHKHSIALIPPSAHWRFLRKTLVKYLFSPQHLNVMETLRMKKVSELVSLVNQFCERGEAIDLARASFVTSFNIISNALLSVDFATYDSNSSSHEFHDTVVRWMEITGKPNGFIDARMAKRSSKTEGNEGSSIDMLDSLMDLTQRNTSEFTMKDMKHLLLVFMNVWAIGRDSNVWENPMNFEPKRFLLREIDLKGKDFELLPFGAGRRMCPGIMMALRTTSLVLASLLYSFDWKLQNGVNPQNLDTSEVFGLTLHKAKPLYAVPVKKHILSS